MSKQQRMQVRVSPAARRDLVILLARWGEAHDIPPVAAPAVLELMAAELETLTKQQGECIERVWIDYGGRASQGE